MFGWVPALIPLLFFHISRVYTDDVNWTIKNGVMSEYLAKPGITLHDNPVTVNEVTASYGEWYAGMWSSFGMTDARLSGDFGDEVDFYAGLRGESGILRLDLSGNYFMLNELSHTDDDQVTFDVRLDMPKVKLVQPYFAARYFGGVGESSPEHGWFMWWGATRRQSLPFRLPRRRGNAFLDIDAQVAYSDGALRREPGIIYGRFSVGTGIPVSKQTTLRPVYILQVPSGDQTGHRGDYTDRIRHVVGFSLITKF